MLFLGLISDWIAEEMMLKKRNLEGIAIAGDLHGQMGGAPRESGTGTEVCEGHPDKFWLRSGNRT